MQQLNIVGIIFTISESALQRWKSYRMGLYRYFVAQPDGEEILADIEHHIAEIFWETTNDNTRAINDVMMLTMIARVGNVADFMEVEVSAPYSFALEEMLPAVQGAKRTATQEKDLPKRTRLVFAPYNDDIWSLNAYRTVAKQSEDTDINTKKLYRDSKRAMLGGVAAGTAHYFQLDVVWVRLLLLAIFVGFVPTTFATGTLMSVYIICWIVLPHHPNLPESAIHRRLYRDLEEAQIAGVCAGIARYFAWDEKRVRTAFVISAFTGVGIGLYAMLWAIMPKKKVRRSFFEELETSSSVW